MIIGPLVTPWLSRVPFAPPPLLLSLPLLNFQRRCRACVSVRGVSMSRDRVYPAARHRLLPHSGLCAVDADRHPVLGVLLDQRRRESGARLHRPADRVTLTTVSDQCDRVTTGRPADRADHDDDEQRCSRLSTSRLLHQGDRRLDDRLSGLRVHISHRVRHRQCSGSTHDATKQTPARATQLHAPPRPAYRHRSDDNGHCRLHYRDHQRGHTVGQCVIGRGIFTLF